MAAKKRSRSIIWFILLLAIAAGGYYFYQTFLVGKINLKDKNYTYIYIEENDTYSDVLSDINAENIIADMKAFEWLASEMDLEKNIHPGKYRIINGMSMRQIINLIKYNKQEKVKLTYNSQIHTLEEFIEYTDDKLALNADALEEYLEDEETLFKDFGLSSNNAFALITPGVYEVSWAISAEELFKELNERFKKTWTKERRARAEKIGFTVAEVITIASIVQSESSISSEQQKIAGVYINRLKKDMLLQADPTLKFANKNYEVQRILDDDKEINSPYNTYMYKGLPPGPICPVTLQAIDATLNYTHHNFIFFCAKPQLNGYSDFSVTYEQHRKFAVAYQKALNKKGINR